MPLITLLTDFGLKDEYVGVMKGVILSINPDARIVDISHDILPQNVIQASYMLEASFRYFPEGSIHVAIVDPGVGTGRRILAVKHEKHYFLAPDNGVLSCVIQDSKPEIIVEVSNREYFLENISNTFHGRDIFAPVAAGMSKGVPLNRFGENIDLESLKQIKTKGAVLSEAGMISGIIVHKDRFGNLITNIKFEDIIGKFKSDFQGNKNTERQFIHGKLKLILKKKIINGLSENYSDVKVNEITALAGSRGYIEICAYMGNAGKILGAESGDRVEVILE